MSAVWAVIPAVKAAKSPQAVIDENNIDPRSLLGWALSDFFLITQTNMFQELLAREHL